MKIVILREYRVEMSRWFETGLGNARDVDLCVTDLRSEWLKT